MIWPASNGRDLLARWIAFAIAATLATFTLVLVMRTVVHSCSTSLTSDDSWCRWVPKFSLD